MRSVEGGRLLAQAARLAGPLVAIQLGLMAMGAVDSAFMGRVSPTAFAAVSIGHVWNFGWLVFGMGVLTALDPIVAQAYGAHDRLALARAVQRGVLLALVMALPIALTNLPAERILSLLEQPPDVVPLAGRYAVISIFGVPPFLVFVALRQSLQAMHRLSALLWAIVATNVLNAFLDWVLIFGKLGVPAMGVAGSAWATAVSRWGLVAALVLFAWKDLRALFLARAGRVLAWRPLGRMVAIGIPVGLQFLVEYATFAGVAVLVGTLGADQLAGHQVALTLSSMSFMVPLGISMAGSVLVGNAIGRGDPAGVAAASKLTLAAGAGVMVLFAILFLGAPGPLASIFTDLESVHALAVLLIPIAGIFQVFDGTQVSAMGVLRGMADTRVPMLIHLGGFWGIGIPFACYLGFERGLGARGFWWGLVAGLAAVAVVQVLRVFVKLSHGVERLDLGEPPHPPLPPESERPV